MTCSTDQCGVGGWGGPLPGDPDNNSILTATPAFGGIDVSWSYPATNPQAVAHVLLYRGTSNDFGSAILRATVGGNFFYDKTTALTLTQYWYWIKIVSVNGTVGARIGPASATAKPTIAQVIEDLSGKIDAGVLAQSLKTQIDKITLNGLAIETEVANRLAANTALSTALAQVQSGVNQTLAFINTEITTRQEGDSALVGQINTIAAANATNTAAIQTETNARVSANTALTQSFTTLSAQVNHATTGLPATRALLASDYYTKTDTNTAISSAVQSLVSTTALGTALNAYTTSASLQSNYYTKTSTDSAISSAITSSQTTFNTNIASAQTTLQANINTVDGKVTAIGALYTAKVSANGLVGGFGIYNNGSTVEAGFDVSTFWVGSTAANKKKPFIITNGQVFIDQAVINQLTFTKLRDESGAVMVENGKLKADYIQTKEIMGGSFTQYNWPVSGLTGFYLGPSGLLLGNKNDNKYFQVEAGGNIFAPGFSIIDGNATFGGTLSANVTQYTKGSTWMFGFTSTSPYVYVVQGGMTATSTISIPVSAGKKYVVTASNPKWLYRLMYGIISPFSDGPGGSIALTVSVSGFNEGEQALCLIDLPVYTIYDTYKKGTHAPEWFADNELVGGTRGWNMAESAILRHLCAGTASGSSLTVTWWLTMNADITKLKAQWSGGKIMHITTNDSPSYKEYANRGIAGYGDDMFGMTVDLFTTQYA